MKTDPLREFRRQMIIFAEYYDEHADEMCAEQQAWLARRMCQSVADFWDLPGDFTKRRGPRRHTAISTRLAGKECAANP